MKTVIIKWDPLWSEVTLSCLIRYINNYNRSYCPVGGLPFYIPDDIEMPARFFFLKCGYGQNGIFCSGIVTRQKFKLKNSSDDPTVDLSPKIDFHIEIFLNFDALPILSMDELATSLPSYDWGKSNKEIMVLSEKDSQTLEDLWLFHIEKNRELIANKKSAQDCCIHNQSLRKEVPSTFTKKSILLKWAPRTSTLTRKDFDDRILSGATNRDIFLQRDWIWPILDLNKFSRHDEIYVVKQEGGTMSLFFYGQVASIPTNCPFKEKDKRLWIHCRHHFFHNPFSNRYTEEAHHFSIPEIATIVPDISEKEVDQEIVLNENQSALLSRLINTKSFDLPF